MLVRFQGGQVNPGVERGKADDKQPDPVGKPEPPQNLLQNEQERRAIADQQQGQLVNDAVTDALRLVRRQPGEAHNLLKRTLDNVRTNPDINEAARVALSRRLENSLQQVDRDGAIVARNQAERLELEARAGAIIKVDDALGQVARMSSAITWSSTTSS